MSTYEKVRIALTLISLVVKLLEIILSRRDRGEEE